MRDAYIYLPPYPQVCSEELEVGASVLWLPCSHIFHERCIRQWLTGFSNTCPTCRATVIPAAPAPAPAGGASLVADNESGVAQLDVPTGDAATLLDAGRAPLMGNRGVISTNRIVSSIMAEVFSALSIPPPPSLLPSMIMSLEASTGHRDSTRPIDVASPIPSPRNEADGGKDVAVVSQTSFLQSESADALQQDSQDTVEDSDIKGEAGCAAANTLDDPTYKRLQMMYK